MTRLRQQGSGLIEVMVALAIGLLLLSVLVMIFTSTKLAQSNQSGLARLQDNQRTAMTLINTIVQSAGYYPNPQAQAVTDALPASGAFAAGQSITGTSGVSGASDTLSIRFATAPNDGVLNCNGTSNTGAGNTIYINQFAVNGNNQLTCALNGGTAQPLVDGVASMSVLYGVDGAGNGSVNHYYPASTLPSGAVVRSVKVILTMLNPLSSQVTVQNPATSSLTVSWVIGVMNQL
ncbi:PilW family protein [Chromobacterium alticapitis]|uniref:Pilus assembly protein n=1 Tax=Chromobacterium alticapitis TaxID=2073169 RepID=A0A2S5DBQ1_9NEIS|nr:PilW family protein [Chromobacterium alticapitis]POZ60499.1 pilus assembly protein [Chromobacterium alticapitis]